MFVYNPGTIEYNIEKLSGFYRDIIAKQNNFVIKVGTEVLTDAINKLRKEKVWDIVDQAAEIHKKRDLVTIVTSGAIATGLGKVGLKDYDKSDIAMAQSMASTGQIDLSKEYDERFQSHDLFAGQYLPTYYDLTNPLHIKNFRNSSTKGRRYNIVPVLNENDVFSVEELLIKINGENSYGSISFGDNDKLSLMAADALNAKVLVMLMNERGIMDYKKGKIDIVYNLEGIERYFSQNKSKKTKGGIGRKCKIAKKAQELGIYVIFAYGGEDNTVLRILNGEPSGTLIMPKRLYLPKSL